VTVVPLSNAVSVTPDGGTASHGPGVNTSAAFTVTDVGNSSPSTYSLSCGHTGVVASCSVTPSVQVYVGTPQTVNVSYTTSSNLAGGTGTVTLTATNNGGGVHTYTDQGSYNVTVPDSRTYTVAVTPDATTSYNEQSVATNFSFTVANSGNTTASYTLTIPTCTGTGSGCSFSPSSSVTTTTVSVGNGANTSVPVYFTTGPLGQNTAITVHASGSSNSNDGSVTIVPLAPTVHVAPVSSSENATENSSGTYAFLVDNQGSSGQITYTLQVTGCTAPLTSCTVPSSVTVAQGADSIVHVSFQTTGTSGTGQISLRAYKTFVHTYESTGTGSVDVNSAITVSTSFMNNDDQDMNLCAASCFAMTASRSTVPYYTLDTPRSVTLMYNGDRVFPRPFVYADVSVQSAPSSIASYTLQVKRNGAFLPFVNGDTVLKFAGTTTPATTYRLAGQVDMSSYSTGIDSVTLVVTAHYTGGASDVATVKTYFMIVNSTLNTDAGEVAKGWSIAGLQHLRATSEGPGIPGWSGNGYMIENGDGSAVYFGRAGGSASDFTTLTFDSVATWTRTYQDGSRVLFDLAGRMTTAIDRLGRQTVFGYGGLNGMQVTSITEPMRSSGHSTSAPYLVLSYDGSHHLSSIVETGGTGGRTTSVTVDGNGHLTRITDLDGGYDSYGYDVSGRLHTITDRRGSTTTYNYGSSWKLASIESPSVPIDNLAGGTTTGAPTVTVAPWQAVGVPVTTTDSNPATLVEPDTIAARITDANGNVSTLYPDRLGEPIKTIDPLGNTTLIEREWYLPIAVTHPDSSVDLASYSDETGLLLTQRTAGQQWVTYTYGSKNQLETASGAGVISVTNTLDSLGRVTRTQYGSDPGDTTAFTYDSVTGNVSGTTQPGVGHATYQYDSNFGNLSTETDPGNRVTQNYFDSYGRDTATKAPQRPVTKTVYDVLNRVTEAYDGHAINPVRIKYDAILPVSIRDQLSHVDSTEYDALGRVSRYFGYASLTLPTTIRYDLGGRPTSTTNRRGERIDVTYDALDRPLTKSGTNTSADTLTYSANGLIATAKKRDGFHSYGVGPE
jgi:YD repeat-containing protein